MENTVIINGMKCDGCVNRVKENFEKIAGVQSVSVNLEKKSASIISDREISNDELKESLSETKFTIA